MSQTPRAAVIGHPVAHSKSPVLHGHWLRRYGIAGAYGRLDVPPGALAEVLKTLPAQGYVGANVTIPHKVAALSCADEVTERAQRIGAANTLYFENGRILADNTDGIGFLANLRQGAPGWQPPQGPAVVLGAGGAARAVVVALLEAGVPQIRLLNRTRAKAEDLSAIDPEHVTVVEWDALPESFAGAALVVNTTSLGMVGQPDLPVDPAWITPDMVVTDLVYAPLMTPLLLAAQERSAFVVDGLGMLLHQAAPGFARWFGTEPEIDKALRQEVLA